MHVYIQQNNFIFHLTFYDMTYTTLDLPGCVK